MMDDYETSSAQKQIAEISSESGNLSTDLDNITQLNQNVIRF